MANVTIAVPDELKRRMDAQPDINWSEVARSEILRKLEIAEELDRLMQRPGLKDVDLVPLGWLISRKTQTRLEQIKFFEEFKKNAVGTQEDAIRIGRQVNKGLSDRYRKSVGSSAASVKKGQ